MKGKRERERNIDEREKHRSVASCTHLDWESSLQPFSALRMLQPPEPPSGGRLPCCDTAMHSYRSTAQRGSHAHDGPGACLAHKWRHCPRPLWLHKGAAKHGSFRKNWESILAFPKAFFILSFFFFFFFNLKHLLHSHQEHLAQYCKTKQTFHFAPPPK